MPLLLCLGSHAAAADAAPQRPVVALLRIADETGDAGLSFWPAGLEWILDTALAQIKPIRTCRDGLAAAYREVGVAGDSAISVEEARRIGEVIEAQRVVWGKVRREGAAWRLTFRILAVSSGEVSSDLVAAGEDLWEVRDRAVAGILQALDVKLTAPEQELVARRWTTSSDAFEHLVRAYHGTRERVPFQELERHARLAVVADPRCVRARAGLAALLGTQGKLDDAERELEAALALEPEGAFVLMRLGAVQAIRNQLAKARLLQEQAHKFDSDDPESLVRLGEIEVSLGDLDRAAARFEAARRLAPTMANVHAKLGEVLARQGREEQALAALSRAERLTTGEEINDEQCLLNGYRALRETARALQHGERFLALASARGIPASRLSAFESLVAALRRTLKATPVDAVLPRNYSASELEAALREKLADEELALCAQPLASTAELRAKAALLTVGAATEMDKARALFEALRRRSGQTGRVQPRTAAVALAAWDDTGERLVCQDYAVLLTVLARESGLEAWFVLVDRDPQGRTVNHGCSAIRIDGKLYLVDPTYAWFGAPHQELKVIDDVQVTAFFLALSQDLTRARLAHKLWPSSIHILCSLAGRLANEGSFVEARKLIESAASISPTSWHVSYAKGYVAWKEERLDEAFEMARASVAANGSYGPARITLAGLLLREGKLEEALEQLHAALNCDLDEESLCTVRRRVAEIHERRTRP